MGLTKPPSTCGPDGHSYVSPHPVIISVDGACRGNGTGRGKASLGIYVDDQSKFNESIPLNLDNPSNQKAEIMAGIYGLNKAREMDGGPSRHVVIKSDSQYMVKGVNKWSRKWESNGYKAANGQPVTNAVLFQKLIEEKHSLEKSGVRVEFQHVPREQNRDADNWANRAFSDHISEANYPHDEQDDCYNGSQNQYPESEPFSDMPNAETEMGRRSPMFSTPGTKSELLSPSLEWSNYRHGTPFSYTGSFDSHTQPDKYVELSNSGAEQIYEHSNHSGSLDCEYESYGNDEGHFEELHASLELYIDMSDPPAHEPAHDDPDHDDFNYGESDCDESYSDESFYD